MEVNYSITILLQIQSWVLFCQHSVAFVMDFFQQYGYDNVLECAAAY